jgi:hypothetical protein
MPKVAIGLTSIEISAIAGDGGLGTSFAAVGYTVADTAVLATEEGQTTEFNIEEQDEAIYSIVSQKGKTTLSWSCYDVDTDTLIKFFGGTKTAGPPEVWSAPDAVPEIEVSIRVNMKTGGKVEIVRGKIAAKLNWAFQKSKLAQIDIVATILAPTKAATPAYRIHDAA